MNRTVITTSLLVLFCAIVIWAYVGAGNFGINLGSVLERFFISAEARLAYGDMLHERAALEKGIAAMKDHAGSPLMVCELNIFEDGKISVQRQKQDKPEELEEVYYEKRQWLIAPVKIYGSGRLEDFVGDFGKFDATILPDLVKLAEDKAREAGFKNARASKLTVSYREQQFRIDIVVASYPQGVIASLQADQNGRNINFKKYRD